MNKNILVPKFPNDFYKFDTSPVSYISDGEINCWIVECIEALENDKNSPSWSISSGDAEVSVHRNQWRENKFIYEVTVSRGRYEATIYEKDNPNLIYKGNK